MAFLKDFSNLISLALSVLESSLIIIGIIQSITMFARGRKCPKIEVLVLKKR